MRMRQVIRQLETRDGLARWEVSGGRHADGEVVRLRDGTLRCITCWSLPCAHVHAAAPHAEKVHAQ